MTVLSALYATIIDALFPISASEKELFAMSPAEAYERLPRAPGYEGLTVELPNASSVFAYKDERAAKLVWNIKYKKSRRAVAIAAYVLWQELKKNYTRAILIPMPVTSSRRRERGYNQCELIVDEIRRLDTDARFIIEKDLLVRIHHTSRQTLKNREERTKGATGIFAIYQKIIPVLPIIVIDDVITTGSTMKEALDTLASAGFENVHGLSLAH